MYKAFIEPDLKVGGCGVAVACRWLARVRPPGQRDSQLCGGCPGLFTHARMNRTASQPLLLLLQGAHLRVYNTFNPFSGFMSPTYILKSAKPVAKGEVAKVLKVRMLCSNHECTSTLSCTVLLPWRSCAGCAAWSPAESGRAAV